MDFATAIWDIAKGDLFRFFAGVVFIYEHEKKPQIKQKNSLCFPLFSEQKKYYNRPDHFNRDNHNDHPWLRGCEIGLLSFGFQPDPVNPVHEQCIVIGGHEYLILSNMYLVSRNALDMAGVDDVGALDPVEIYTTG